MKSETAFIATKYGRIRVRAFEGAAGRKTAALVFGDIAAKTDVSVRVQSACLTSTVLGSLLCDCQQQITQAFEVLASSGSGLFIYLDDEGRGHGLVEKIGQFSEQNQGADTVEAALRRGVQPDLRDYSDARNIIDAIAPGRPIRLLTNNPTKLKALQEHGIVISDRVPLEAPPTDHNRAYLVTKRDRLGHLLTISEDEG